MKKCLLILIAILMICLCSCSIADYLPLHDTPATMNPYLEVVPDELTYSEGYEPVTSSYAYDELPLEGEKQLYQKVLEVCYDISPDKDDELDRYAMPQMKLDGCSLTEAQVRTACKALTDDHPEIFWVTGTMGFYSGEDTTVIQLYSKYSPEEINSRVNAVRSQANDFYATVPDGLSEFDREAMVHDYLIEHVAYDESVDTINIDSNSPDIYTVYGALVDQTAVCEGYARAFQMLMNGLGVDCVGLMGSSQDQMHMWNAAKIDGTWYQTDVTWDDQEEPYERHVYCNVSDAFMYDDHTLSPLFSELSDEEINGEDGDYSASVMNVFVPVCPDGTKSYYAVKAPRLTDFDAAEVKNGLLACAVNHEDYFVFYIDEELDYNSTIKQLFSEYPQYFFDYVRTVNDYLTDYSIDASNASYFTHEKSRIAAVELHYY